MHRCETKTLDNVFVNVVVSVQYQVPGCCTLCCSCQSSMGWLDQRHSL